MCVFFLQQQFEDNFDMPNMTNMTNSSTLDYKLFLIFTHTTDLQL